MLIDWIYPQMECLAVRESNQPIYSEELSRFLTAQAALMDAQPIKISASPYEAIHRARMCEGITPMPPEFQLMHPRRVRRSGWHTQPDGQSFHFIGYAILTSADEASYRLSDPENGLHPDDLKAFRASLRGPVKHGPVARFFAMLKFWR